MKINYLIKFIVKCKNKISYIFRKFLRKILGFEQNKDVLIIPHEGLGDLISILPALQELDTKGFNLTLVTERIKWLQIENSFLNVPKIKIINFKSNGSYTIPDFINASQSESLVALGFFSKFPIVDYPSSFFWQLGVSKNLVNKFIELKPLDWQFELPDLYEFIDLNTSTGSSEIYYSKNSNNTIQAISNCELIVRNAGIERKIILDENYSFHQKIYIALRSTEIICSDAALFNALIRLEQRPKIIVQSRDHLHSHSKEIYKHCKFDGKKYEFPAIK